MHQQMRQRETLQGSGRSPGARDRRMRTSEGHLHEVQVQIDSIRQQGPQLHRWLHRPSQVRRR